jgi:hypothetical protein
MTDEKKPAKPKPKAKAKPPAPEDFHTPQIDLFQQFIYNNEDDREGLSNTLDLWDSVPRYSVSRQAMAKLRTEKGFLDLLKLDFTYKGTPLKVVIQPARIEEADGASLDYYPSANEELVEDALRKIAAERNRGYYGREEPRSGVVFTLHELREELKRRGHARSYQQITLSLNILARSSIEIRAKEEGGSDIFAISNYLSSLAAVSRKQLKDDPQAKWIAQFHPLVTQSIDALTYRQFNYAQMMSHTTQLARWLHKQLSLKFTFASIASVFEMRYSTIKRDSGLLTGYSRERKAIEAVDAALGELQAGGVLMFVKKNDVRGLRGKLEDVVYTLTASMAFVAETKIANKRHMIATEAREAVDKTAISVDKADFSVDEIVENFPGVGKKR